MLTKIAAIVDANVMMDALSSHDLMSVVERRRSEGTLKKNSSDQYFRWRCRRARAAALLGCHLHDLRAVTLSLCEPALKLLEIVPPEIPLGQSFSRDFMMVSIHMVHEVVFAEWRSAEPGVPEVEKAGKADAKVLELARMFGVRVITNEGWSPDGVRDEGLRADCKKCGVIVGTAEEAWEDALDPEVTIAHFFRRFDAAGAEYEREHFSRHGADAIGALIRRIRYFYETVFELGNPALAHEKL